MENTNTVTISLDEYKDLLEKTARIKVFENYVSAEKYSINKEMCGTILGIEVSKTE